MMSVVEKRVANQVVRRPSSKTRSAREDGDEQGKTNRFEDRGICDAKWMDDEDVKS